MFEFFKKPLANKTRGTPKKPRPRVWYCPDGTPAPLASELLTQPHLLIAGATGSGKSVLLNSIIYDMLLFSPVQKKLILIDPKRVELVQFRQLPHALRYASEPPEILAALQYAVDEMESRYKAMQAIGLRKWSGDDVYIVVDEYADLIVTQKKQVKPLFIRLAQLGRAANIHLIICTQRPTRDIIDGAIKVNLDSRIALRCPTPQDSRNIIDVRGAEELPLYGYGLYRAPAGIRRVKIDMIQEHKILERVRWWTEQKENQEAFEKSHGFTPPEWLEIK